MEPIIIQCYRVEISLVFKFRNKKLLTDILDRTEKGMF